ncbi:lycopene cyclase family protein [Pseudonocardiaceae bacterium YIM PH 21723]|nr:lycopene cyclase family protein [Pseudonocardiaceae bacterium YIM PH 21723]
MNDVLIAGGGPAGRALAAACVDAGLDTALVDPAPERAWRATYAAWSDELPTGLTGIAGTVSRARIHAVQEHRLDRSYTVLDNGLLRRALDREDLQVITGQVVRSAADSQSTLVRLLDGRGLRCRIMIDCTGGARPHQRLAPQTTTAQSAYGVIVAATEAGGLIAPGEALIMDWRAADQGPATFLYAVPLPGDRVLLEETCLAGRPALPMPVLRQRLYRRLSGHGVDTGALHGKPVERVWFPLDVPLPGTGSPAVFGSAAGLIHPATGYGVAMSLRLAPLVAALLADTTGYSTARRHAEINHLVWPRGARLVHTLRRYGLHRLLAMPPSEIPRFFDAFFRLPADRQLAYLSNRTDVRAVLGAMAGVFALSPWRLRKRLMAGVG